MKKIFLIIVTCFALLVAYNINRVYAGNDAGRGILLSKLEGEYSQTLQGSISVCFKPDFSGTEDCSTSGVVPVSVNFVLVGQFTQDKDGDACGSYTATSGIPGTTANFPILHDHFVGKVTDYDPSTGSGDESFTDYIGGTCRGANFDKTGATLNSKSTSHFVASGDGEREDVELTTLNDLNPVGDNGAFNLIGFNLKQND